MSQTLFLKGPSFNQSRSPVWPFPLLFIQSGVQNAEWQNAELQNVDTVLSKKLTPNDKMSNQRLVKNLCKTLKQRRPHHPLWGSFGARFTRKPSLVRLLFY